MSIKQSEKKKLPLFPSIIVKCKDLGAERSKNKFQVLLGQSKEMKESYLKSLNVSKAVALGDSNGISG